MEKEKIYELRIEEEDDLSGIDSISLVQDPAIEINWLAFNKQKEYFNIPDGEEHKYLFMLEGFGQDEEELIQQGYRPFKVGNFELQKFFDTYPNADSEWNTDEYLVRYKYMLNPEVQNNRNPIIPTTREFCSNLIKKNYVFRIEDMDRLTNDQGTSALVWRGGYNCRHSWSKILYKKDTNIVNKASINKGKVLDAGGVFPTDLTPDLAVLGYGQPNTRTKNPSFSKQKFEIENEDKRIVIGPAMIPNVKMVRADKDGNPYYVFFTEDTIRMIAEKYMKNGYLRNNDVNHDGEAVKDVYVIESWIKTSEDDKSTKYGFKDLPIGSWFVSMKIKDDFVWDKVKKGELKGFSVSGFFDQIEQFNRQKEVEFLKELAQILKNIN